MPRGEAPRPRRRPVGAGARPPVMSRRRAVFLDRDGVLVADMHHLRRADQLRLLPGVPEALVQLREAGWALVVATNQSVVARGWLSEEGLGRVHGALIDMLRERGAMLDRIYYCPHHPDGEVPEYRGACSCRKPNPGMLLRAAEELDLELADSVMVGDAPSDIEAGRRAGCRSVLISRGAVANGPAPIDADYVAPDLRHAAAWIVALPPASHPD
jgi:D,D-heptose 1,7-bisphosphate phosphatase